MLQRNKLRSKDRWFNRRLLLRRPINQRHVAKDSVTCAQLSGFLVFFMVTINFSPQFNILYMWRRRVWWNCLLLIPTEVILVTILEDNLINFGMGWIKYKSGVVFLFQVSHHMQHGLNMPLFRIINVRRN